MFDSFCPTVGGGGGLLRAAISGTTARLRQNRIPGPFLAQDDSTTPPVVCRTFSHGPISELQNAMKTNANGRQPIKTLRIPIELAT